MNALRRTGPATVAVLAAAALLTGCAGGASTPSGGGPTPEASATPTAGPEAPGPVELPWPAPTPGEAAALQTAVDGGSQPWLLDPSEVALAYVAAAHGWTDAVTTTGPAGPGTATVAVRGADGEQVTLTLAQPARTDRTGIWLVATDTPT